MKATVRHKSYGNKEQVKDDWCKNITLFDTRSTWKAGGLRTNYDNVRTQAGMKLLQHGTKNMDRDKIFTECYNEGLG